MLRDSPRFSEILRDSPRFSHEVAEIQIESNAGSLFILFEWRGRWPRPQIQHPFNIIAGRIDDQWLWGIVRWYELEYPPLSLSLSLSLSRKQS